MADPLENLGASLYSGDNEPVRIQEQCSAMDDDDKKPEDAAAEPAPDGAQDEGAKLREVSEEGLKRILAAHETWLETGGKEGKRADLSRTDLKEADLSMAKAQATAPLLDSPWPMRAPVVSRSRC